MKKRKLKVLYILLTVTLAFFDCTDGNVRPQASSEYKGKETGNCQQENDNGDVSHILYDGYKTRIARVESW